MLSRNKRAAYAVILAGLTVIFFLTNGRVVLREMLAYAQAYYRGEYTITTYYPAPYGGYQDIRMRGALTMVGTGEPGVSSAGEGIIYFDSTSNRFRVSENGQIYKNLGVAGGAGGLWDTFANSSNDIYATNIGNVGIGFTGSEVSPATPQYKLHVVGSFAATYKNFEIPHPLDPKNKLLIHSSLEGPEHAVYYRGEAELVNSEATITLPDYFEALTRKEGRTVQLTPLGGYSELYVVGGVKDGKFSVRSAQGNNPSQKFYWEVKAVRADIPPLEEVRKK